jgi:hypothetical protein
MCKGDHVHRTIFWNSSNEIAPVFCGSLSATIWAASLSEICAVLVKQQRTLCAVTPPRPGSPERA